MRLANASIEPAKKKTNASIENDRPVNILDSR
jgi:hypothetical protein